VSGPGPAEDGPGVGEEDGLGVGEEVGGVIGAEFEQPGASDGEEDGEIEGEVSVAGWFLFLIPEDDSSFLLLRFSRIFSISGFGQFLHRGMVCLKMSSLIS